MTSIKRFTKRVKHTILALALDARGEDISSAKWFIGAGFGVVASGMIAQHQLSASAANSNTEQSGAGALTGKLATMTGGSSVAAASASSPAGN